MVLNLLLGDGILKHFLEFCGFQIFTEVFFEVLVDVVTVTFIVVLLIPLRIARLQQYNILLLNFLLYFNLHYMLLQTRSLQFIAIFIHIEIHRIIWIPNTWIFYCDFTAEISQIV